MATSCSFPRPADVGDDNAPADAGDVRDVGDGGDMDDTGGTPGNAACQLTAIVPAIANTNDVLMIEGTFADAVTVNFPGGTAVAATVLGPHRARVTVPASATEGELTITSCGSNVGSLAFRRASFALGIGTFEASFEQADIAQQPVALTAPREHHTSVVVGSHFYIIGGAGGDGALISVEQATVNANGSLGPFSRAPNVSLVTARQAHTTAMLGSKLYVIGGLGDGPLSSVEQATINADGSLGTFSTVATVALATARHGHASAVVGNHIYILGGFANTALDSVERAIISPDGSLGPFAAVPGVTLTLARRGHSATVAGNYLYVMGGTRTNSALPDVERASINPDGTLGPFAPVTTATLTTARSGHTTEVLGSYLYVVGGTGSTGTLNSVERAPLSDTGSVGSFARVSGTVLTTARHGHTSALIGNYLYGVGGNSSGLLNSIERAALNVSGSVGPFAAVADASLATPTGGHSSAVFGNYVYVFGGSTHEESFSNQVARAVINRDGSLRPFTKLDDIMLTTGRFSPANVVIGNQLYVLGGFGSLNSAERATINSDGSIGPFASVPDATLTTGRQRFTASVVSGHLYVIGGNDNLGALRGVERASINADGSLGPFSAVSELATARDGHTAVLVGNSLYIIGGTSSTITNKSPPLRSVERATVGADGSLGVFALVTGVSLISGRFGHTSAVIGNYLYVFGGQGDTDKLDGIERAFISPDGSLTTFEVVTGVQLRTARAFHTTTASENYLYVIGGNASSAAGNIIERTILTTDSAPAPRGSAD